jgi:hypothetical protein
LFEVSVSEYWLNHYQFDKESQRKRNYYLNPLSIYCYQHSATIRLCRKVKERNFGGFNSTLKISPEKNAIIDKFNS